jgi:amino acid transporter
MTKLEKQLSALDVFCIAAGAMISSGIFILPGLAFSHAGPSVVIAYFFAGILALIGVLSVVELSTAMPKAGGDYYFVTRSLGPVIGTVSGLLSWFALSLKTAFAIFGIAEVTYLLTGVPVFVVAAVACAVFVALNIVGVASAAKLEVYLVLGLLALMVLYVLAGVGKVRGENFTPFAPEGVNAIFSTAGFVFVSFGGLLNIATVAEEVKHPKRNIPIGLIAAVATITVLYALLLVVTVGVLPAEQLSNSFSPLADTARQLVGPAGYALLTLAAILAFVTTANAGIMSASRYPLALGRDRLVPSPVARVHKKRGTPVVSIVVTGVVIVASLLLDLELLVKAASTVVLTSYVLSNVAVMVIRRSKLVNYQPSFRVPLCPWLPLIGIVLFVFLIVDMGLAAVEISFALVAAALLTYLFYGRKHAKMEYALLHLLERVTARQLTDDTLESELREIIHERDEVIHDAIDEMVKVAAVVDEEGPIERDKLFRTVAKRLSGDLPLEEKAIYQLLEDRERQGSTAVMPFVAIPHIIIEGTHQTRILLARCKKGAVFSDDRKSVKAAFVIVGTKDDRHLHLKALAAVAQIAQHKHFEQRWLEAKSEQQLRDLILLSERIRS